MKCEICGGAIVKEKGYCENPDRLFCFNCGREPGQPKKKEDEMELEERKCVQCGTEFPPKRNDSRFCSKVCSDKWTRKNRKSHKKKSIKNPKPPENPKTVSEGIPLDMQLIRAIRKSAADQIIKIIQEAFA